jgi:hypothetical protein
MSALVAEQSCHFGSAWHQTAEPAVKLTLPSRSVLEQTRKRLLQSQHLRFAGGSFGGYTK